MPRSSMHETKQRRYTGLSLPELLVSLLIMSYVMAGLVGLIYTSNAVNFRLSHKVDNILMCQQAVDRLQSKIREARYLGDGYSCRYFPLADNPIYGRRNQQKWTAQPWPNPPYVLSGHTLILQIPVFDNDGFPQSLQTEYDKSQPVEEGAEAAEDLDTYVYQVLPDPLDEQKCILQESLFPGQHHALTAGEDNCRHTWTIAQGIAGPLDSDGQPLVFQYLVQGQAPHTSPGDWTCPQVNGITVNLEIKTDSENKSKPAVIGVKVTTYLKSNIASTVCSLKEPRAAESSTP